MKLFTIIFTAVLCAGIALFAFQKWDAKQDLIAAEWNTRAHKIQSDIVENWNGALPSVIAVAKDHMRRAPKRADARTVSALKMEMDLAQEHAAKQAR